MRTSCEQMSDRIVELLYGELSDDGRTSLDAHLAGCDRCRSEIEAFRGARAAVRRVLDEPLPAAARANILRAAAEQAQAAAGHAAPGGSSRPVQRRVPEERPSFWDWLR